MWFPSKTFASLALLLLAKSVAAGGTASNTDVEEVTVIYVEEICACGSATAECTTNTAAPITTISVCPSYPAVTVTATEQLITSCGDSTPTPTTTVCTTGGVYNLGSDNFCIVKDADCPTTISYNAPCQTCFACPYNQCYDKQSSLSAVKHIIVYEYLGSEQIGCTYEDWYCHEVEQYYTHSTYIASPTIFIYNNITINVTVAPTLLTFTETSTVTSTSTKTVGVSPTGSDDPISREPSGQLSSTPASSVPASSTATPTGGVALQFYLDAKQGQPIVQRDGKLAYDSSATAPVTVYLRGDELYDADGKVLYINLTDLVSDDQSIIYFALDSTQVPSDGESHIFSLNGTTLKVTVNGETLIELTCSDDGFIHFGRAAAGNCQAGILVTTPVSTSSSPSAAPSSEPQSASPSIVPSSEPQSVAPSLNPASFSNGPSSMPSVAPSATPSSYPSNVPSVPVASSGLPSAAPSDIPSSIPSVAPSDFPSSIPSVAPSDFPSSAAPSDIPSSVPSVAPSDIPSSAAPSDSPSSVASVAPSASPSQVLPSSPDNIGITINQQYVQAYNPNDPPVTKKRRRSLAREALVTATLLDETSNPVIGVQVTIHAGNVGEAIWAGVPDITGTYTGTTDSNGQLSVSVSCKDASAVFDFSASYSPTGFQDVVSPTSVPLKVVATQMDCSTSIFQTYSADGDNVNFGDEVDFTISLYDYYDNPISIETYPICLNVNPSINNQSHFCLDSGATASWTFSQSTYAGAMTFTADSCSSTFTKTYTWVPPTIQCSDVEYQQGWDENETGTIVNLILNINPYGTPLTGAVISVSSANQVFWPTGMKDTNVGPSLTQVTLVDNGDGTYSWPSGYDTSYVYNDLAGTAPYKQDTLTVQIASVSLTCATTKEVTWDLV